MTEQPGQMKDGLSASDRSGHGARSSASRELPPTASATQKYPYRGLIRGLFFIPFPPPSEILEKNDFTAEFREKIKYN
jgi:hypothetical protein